MDEQERILSLWEHEGSVKAICRATGISEQRVRRILIDNGITPSDRTREIQALAGAGMTPEQIAAHLGISLKAAQSHLPYLRGTYTGKSHTTAWRRSKETE